MAKSETIILRVDAETKAWITEAANRQGKSLTTFLLQAAAKAAGKESPISVASLKPRGKGPCPTWFLASCHEAKQGGTNGYYWPGYKLASALGSHQPYEVETDDWADEIERLNTLAQRNEREAVAEWFQAYLPRCLALVPVRRREQFLDGIFQAAEEGKIEM
jgi:hypothetical protein